MCSCETGAAASREDAGCFPGFPVGLKEDKRVGGLLSHPPPYLVYLMYLTCLKLCPPRPPKDAKSLVLVSIAESASALMSAAENEVSCRAA